MQRRKRDQDLFTVVRGILISQQPEMQATLGDGVRRLYGVGVIKRSILVISDSCALQAVRKQ
jgi:hypothetical protein